MFGISARWIITLISAGPLVIYTATVSAIYLDKATETRVFHPFLNTSHILIAIPLCLLLASAAVYGAIIYVEISALRATPSATSNIVFNEIFILVFSIIIASVASIYGLSIQLLRSPSKELEA